MNEVTGSIGIDDPRMMVTVRDMLAGAFLDQLRSIAGDQRREDFSVRRGELQRIASLVAELSDLYQEALPDIMADHQEANWHGPTRWGPSHFQNDYARLLGDTEAIRNICSDILESPAFTARKTGPTGLPAKLPDRLGTWSKEAFAIRLASIYYAATGVQPTLSGSQPTTFQRFAENCDELFQTGYHGILKPFGEISPLTIRDLRKACARYK